MGLRIKYTVDGQSAVEHKLLGIGERALEPEPVLLAIADVMRAIEAKRFAEEGPGWAPLAASTLERKTEGGKIGEESKAMLESLTKQGAEGSLSEVIGNTLHFGTNLTSEEGFPYPVVFDQGSSRQKPRPLFDIGAMELREFTRAVQAYIMAEASALGFSPRGSDPIPGPKSNIFAGF